MKTFMITGATRGLGLATAQILAQQSCNRVVLAVRNPAHGRKIAAMSGGNMSVEYLDLSSLQRVTEFASSWKSPLDGLINNAGVQITNETRLTTDGFEETVAVNHLAAVSLTVGLLPRLAGGRVLFIGSGTHNPSYRTASLFGFRGPQFTSVEKLARGDGDSSSIRQLGMDRYAASKFLNMITAVELARRYETPAFYTLDPGLMPGTGLVRTETAVIRILWSTIFRWIAPVLPETSTPKRSGAAASWIMTSDELDHYSSGTVFSCKRTPSRNVWKEVYAVETGRRVLDETLALLNNTQVHSV